MKARIFLSAGEASGEQYAVQLMAELRRTLPAAEFYGLGGGRMQAEGFRCVARAEDVAVMGITEILRHIPRIYRAYRRLRRSLGTPRPNIAVLIDFPDVNLALARRCKQLGIPVVFFVSPQVWAWKKHRLPRIRRDVDRMLVIFPFEEPWYRERGIDAAFVGHPLAELPLPTSLRGEFAGALNLDPARQWVGLLPGSRLPEILLNLPAMLGAAALLAARHPGRFAFILPLAPTLTGAQVARIQALTPPTLHIVFSRDARTTLHHARASIVASGTATVEAALIGNPFVVVYRLSRLSYAVARRFVRVPHVAMVNLIAGHRIVPEFIQDEYTAAHVSAELGPLLDDTAQRTAMLQALARVGQQLHRDERPISAVAQHVLSLLPTPRHPLPATPSLAL